MPDRRYRHRGYQDSQRTTGSGSGPSSDRPARLEGAPRGRGSETNREEVFRCKGCGERANAEVTVSSTCTKCGRALHACSQCRHFDTLARNQCRREIPALVPAKNAGNDCTLYEPAMSLDLKGRTAIDTPDSARSAFDKLFGKK